MRKSVLLSAALLGAATIGWRAWAQDGPPPMDAEPLRRLVFFAVLEGLYEDGVSTGDVDRVLRREPEGSRKAGEYTHFVYACPICHAALDAFRVYRGRARFYATKGNPDTFGAGLPSEVSARLGAESFKERLDALNRLVDRWVGLRLDAMRLTGGEREEWQERIVKGRKEGMGLLQSFARDGTAGEFAEVKTCAVCDGANAACKE
ncbi:MAG: hypothetical protein ACREID_04045 [Planctomycetota bacterium]